MIQVYGSGLSRSLRVLWALEEAGLPYQYHAMRIGRTGENGTLDESYLKLNPLGKVPCLVDDGFIVNESAAILNYIGSLVPEKQLIPIENIQLRAQYDTFCYFVMTELEQPLWLLAKHKFVLPELMRRDIKEPAIWEYNRTIEALMQRWQGRSYAVGERFTMADILLAYTLNWANRVDLPLSPELERYRAQQYQRPACIRAIEVAEASTTSV